MAAASERSHEERSHNCHDNASPADGCDSVCWFDRTPPVYSEELVTSTEQEHGGHDHGGHEEHCGHGDHGGHEEHGGHGGHGGHEEHGGHGGHGGHEEHGGHGGHGGHEEHVGHDGHAGHAQDKQSLAMQAMVIHIIGDIVQSIGIVIAGLLIWLQPFDVGEHCNDDGECVTNWVYADPICTLLFTVLVIWTTIGTVRSIVSQVMMDVPDTIDPADLKSKLLAVRGVTGVHDLHVWQVGQGNFITAHVQTSKEVSGESMRVLKELIKVSQNDFDIGHATFQIELEGQFDRSIEHLRLGAHACNSFSE